MTTIPATDPQVPAALEKSLAVLCEGAQDLPRSSIEERIAVIQEVGIEVLRHAEQWVDTACELKSIGTSAQRSEEILAGPATTARYLTLLVRSLGEVARFGRPRLPGRIARLGDGRLSVPVFPARGMYDALLFRGLQADVWMHPVVSPEAIHGDRLGEVTEGRSPAPVCLVLGAGNVSAIPLTDSLTKLFHEGHVVLLKMNPVNEALTPVFRKVLAPLIRRGWLQVITGGAEMGQSAVASSQVASVHITGSHHTHDRIVWGTGEAGDKNRRDGQPLLDKPITSELGNVTPWIVVPGRYSNRQLRFQATNIAASMTNNAGFNCLTTRVILTGRDWPQRSQFLAALQAALDHTPRRPAYYPGAADRFERFTGIKAEEDDNGSLPWLLMKDIQPDENPLLLEDESFCSACAEIRLSSSAPTAFLEEAVEFCNSRLFGTLCASVTMTNQFARNERPLVESSFSRLNYGTVCLNQWPGLVFGLMTPPWGAAPGSNLDNIQSGDGDVHNLYFLDRFEKTVLRGPLCNFPKPIWFPSHKRSEKVASRLTRFYDKPGLHRLPGLFLPAMLG